MKWLALTILLLWMEAYPAQGQTRLSPRLKAFTQARTYPNRVDTFSVATLDHRQFLIHYAKDIQLIRLHESSSSIVISAQRSLVLGQMIADPNVVFMDAPLSPREESSLEDPDFSFNRIRKGQHEYPGLRGANLNSSIKERAFDAGDIDLVGRSFSIGLAAKSTSQHATDMATIISGAGNSSPLFQGVAPNARFASSDFNNLLPDDEDLLLTHKIFTQNHSYGVGIENYYGVEAMAYDRSVFNQPEILHIFSAGNSGSLIPEDGTYQGLPFANLTGTFKQAKNTLTVSAVDTTLTVSAMNSRGPAYDGRLKPELTAYGGRGTSDAAAMVSGMSMILQESHLHTYGFIPKAELIKAILIASADDIASEGIDYFSGYGSVNLKQALDIQDQSWHFSDTLSSEDENSFQIEVPQNTCLLRVAVCWTDPPAVANSTVALVHDMDATLFLNGQSWLPWVLDNSPNENALTAPAKRAADHLNNVEFFTLADPEAGLYRLQVNAPAFSGDQSISLAWHYKPKDFFEWDFPTASDHLTSGTRERIHWTSTFQNGSGQLSYQHGNGEWTVMDEDVTLKENYYTWSIPDTIAVTRLKMEIGEFAYLSDYFLLSTFPEVSVSFNCEERFGLEWLAIDAASEYEIYEMGANELKLIGTTIDTFYVVSKSESTFYSVAPVFGEEHGLRSEALKYTFQGSFCYFNFFAAERFDEKSVRIALNLSTAIGVEQINIQKTMNGESSLIEVVSPKGKTTFVFNDFLLDPGLMQYQAILYFTDGTSLTSEISQIYIEAPDQAIFFPNPATEGYVGILSSGTGQRLQVLDDQGKLILEKDLFFNPDYIIIQDFREGLYLYRLLEGDKVIDTGKFIKR